MVGRKVLRMIICLIAGSLLKIAKMKFHKISNSYALKLIEKYPPITLNGHHKHSKMVISFI
jgi:hypothetical protein